MTPRRQEVPEEVRILNRQIKRFDKLVAELEAAGTLTLLQKQLDEIQQQLGKTSGKERQRIVKLYTRFVVQSLRSRGVTDAWLARFERELSEEWLERSSHGARIDVRKTIMDIQRRGRELVGPLQEESRRADRVAAGRLLVGGAAVLFDAAKLVFFTPPPPFLYTSIMGGILFFARGADSSDR